MCRRFWVDFRHGMSRAIRSPVSEADRGTTPARPPSGRAYRSERSLTQTQPTVFFGKWMRCGVAVVMMVVYHFVFDLAFLGVSDAVFRSPFWFYFRHRVTATTFVLLVGVFAAPPRAVTDARHGQLSFGPFFRRGLTVFGWGLVLTAVTWLAVGREQAIRFGILHFIGVAMLAAYPFLRLGAANLALGAAFLLFGKWLQTQTFDLPMAVWLGFEPANHTYLDYFPFIKWFGVVLLGLFAGSVLYGPDGRRYPTFKYEWVDPCARLADDWSLVFTHLPASPPLLLGILLVWTAVVR